MVRIDLLTRRAWYARQLDPARHGIAPTVPRGCALYPENDLRQLLIIDLEQQIAAFRRTTPIETMEPKELRRWARWVGTIESTVERAAAAIESGRRLFVIKNLRNLRHAIPHGCSNFSFLAFVEELEEESEPTA
jgi:hypothetical protein